MYFSTEEDYGVNRLFFLSLQLAVWIVLRSTTVLILTPEVSSGDPGVYNYNKIRKYGSLRPTRDGPWSLSGSVSGATLIIRVPTYTVRLLVGGPNSSQLRPVTSY